MLSPSKKIRVIALAFLFTLTSSQSFCRNNASAAETTSTFSQSDVSALRWYDRQVLKSLETSFERDRRYDVILHRVASRLQPQTRTVFPGSDKVCTYHVFANAFGFNAMATYELIIFDSLLLDSIYCLSRAYTFYRTLGNPYTEQLLLTLGNVNIGTRINPHPPNPFRLPTPPRLTAVQKREAFQLFLGCLAFVMGHEGSHSFREHQIRTVCASRVLKARYQGMTPKQIQNIVNYKLSPQLEIEADCKAVELILRSGFSTQGAMVFLRFLELLEANFGLNRTHPPARQRIQAVKRIIRQVKN